MSLKALNFDQWHQFFVTPNYKDQHFFHEQIIIRAKLNLSNQFIAFKKLKKKIWIKTREEDIQVLAEMDLVVDDDAEPWIEPILQQRKKQGEAISNSTISF